MSKIGKKPISIPDGVKVEIKGREILVSGPLGGLTLLVKPEVNVQQNNGEILVERKNESKLARSLHGLTRTLIGNLIEGVSEGFSKDLELSGVGYRARVDSQNLILTLGFSHPVTIEPPQGISFEVKENVISVKGIDKQLVGQVAAKIRKLKLPEPYKGKGIKYVGEVIRKKAGKVAKTATFGGV